jgi:hypothetical protein
MPPRPFPARSGGRELNLRRFPERARREAGCRPRSSRSAPSINSERDRERYPSRENHDEECVIRDFSRLDQLVERFRQTRWSTYRASTNQGLHGPNVAATTWPRARSAVRGAIPSAAIGRARIAVSQILTQTRASLWAAGASLCGRGGPASSTQSGVPKGPLARWATASFVAARGLDHPASPRYPPGRTRFAGNRRPGIE